jgi:hypothetical protein
MVRVTVGRVTDVGGKATVVVPVRRVFQGRLGKKVTNASAE